MEVRKLSQLPPALAAVLGWHRNAKDLIADLDQERAADGPRLVTRWFLVGGVSASKALLATEERAFRSDESIHVKHFTLASERWNVDGEWIVASRPHTYKELSSLLSAPQTDQLTEKWRKRLLDQERDRSMGRSDPSRWHNRLPLREMDINDIEIREIEGVVRESMPGAIVNISGVAKGCPCENGPGCTAQVWLLIYLPSSTHSLEVSQIDGRWTIGPVQQWHLKVQRLERELGYVGALSVMRERFPMCADRTNDPSVTRAP